MKKLMACLLTFALLLAAAIPAFAEVAILDSITDEEFAALTETTVIRDENSPTGWYVTFRHVDPDATRVRIRGEWNFSDAYHSSAS